MHDQHSNAKNNDNKNREKNKEGNNTGMHMSNMIKSKAINENAVQSDVTNEEETMELEVHAVSPASFTDDNKIVYTNNLERLSSNSNRNNIHIDNNGQCEDAHFDTSDIVALKIMENKYESSGIDTSVIHEIMILHKIAQEYTHYMQSKRRLVRCSVDTTASASTFKNTLQKAFTPTTAKTTRRRNTLTHNNMVELNGHVTSDTNTKCASTENNESDFALQNKPLLKFIPRKHFFENDNRKIEDMNKFIFETNKAISLPDSKSNVENYCDTTRDTRNEAVYNPLHTFYFPTELSECEFSLQNDTNDISVTTKRVKTNNAETASLQSLEKYNCDDMCNLEEQNEYESEDHKECVNEQELSLVSHVMDYYHDADEAKHNRYFIENKNAMHVNIKLEEELSNKTLTKTENESGSKANATNQENDSRLGLEKSSTLHSLYTDEKFNDKSKIYSDNTKIVNDYHETRCKNIEQMCEEAMPRQNKEIKQDQNESVYEQKQCEEQMREKYYSREKQQEQLESEEEEYLQSENEDLYYCVDAAEELMQSGVEHIVQMRDVIIDSERNSVYLIMEYCDGGNLRRYLQHLPEHKITDKILYRRWSAEITSALAFLHSQHISHCDLKTENILLQRQMPLQIQENQILSSESYHEHEENEVLSSEEANSHEEINSLHSCKNNVTASDKSIHSNTESNKETEPKSLSTNHTRHALKEATSKNKENFILKLCDFGLSHVEDIPVKKFKHPAVTLWYRPPDVLLNNMHYTYTADAWSLGCVLLEMAVGVAPFRAFNEYEELKCIFKRLGKPTKRNFPSAHHYPCPSLLLTLIDFDETDANEIVKANFSKKSHRDSKSNSNHNKETVNNNTTTTTTTTTTDVITKNGCLINANFNDKKQKESAHKHANVETLVNTNYDNTHVTIDNTTVNNINKKSHDNHNSTDNIEKKCNDEPIQEFHKQDKEMETTNTKALLEQNVQEVRRRLRKYLQAHNSLKVLGRNGLDLVSRLLQYEPAYRLTVMEALHHPFFSNEARSLCAHRFHEFHMWSEKEEHELQVQHLAEQAAFHAQGGEKNLLLQSLRLPSSLSSVQSTPFPCTVNTRCRHDQKHLVSSLENVKQENKLHETEKNDNVDLEKSSAKCLKQTGISVTCVSKDRNAKQTQSDNIKNNYGYNCGDDNNDISELVNNNDITNNNTDDTMEEKCDNSLTTLSLQMSLWPPLLEPLDCPLPPHPTTANASSISSSSFALHDNASSTSLSTFPETHPLTESSLSLPSKEKEQECTVPSTNQYTHMSTQNTHKEMPNRLSQSTPSISATTTKSASTSTCASTSSTLSEKCGLIASHTGHSTFALVPPSCQAIRYPRNSRELPPLPLPQRHRLSSMEIKHMNELHPLSTSWQMLTSSSSTSLSASSSSKSFELKLDSLKQEQERQREKEEHECEESTKHRVHCANNNEIKISKEGKDDKNKKLYADNHRVHASKNSNILEPIIESKTEDHAALSEEMESIPVNNTPNAKDVESKNNKLNVANNDNSENRSKGQINTSNKYKSTQHDNKNKQRTNETNTVDSVYMLNKVNNAQQMLASAFVTKLRQMHSKSFVELEKNNTSGKNKNKIDDKQILSTILIKTADQNEYRDIS